MVGKKNLLLKKTPFLFFSTEGGRWRNFSLTFSESTKNLVVIIHRSQRRPIRSQLQHRLSDQCTIKRNGIKKGTINISSKERHQTRQLKGVQNKSREKIPFPGIKLFSCTDCNKVLIIKNQTNTVHSYVLLMSVFFYE